MKTLTVRHLFAFVVLLVLAMLSHSKSIAPLISKGELATVTPNKETVLPIQAPNDKTNEKKDGEIMETANAIVFRPLFAYRRMQSQRRRVYVPRRRPSYYYY
ncbi:uncharacterized protein LOC123011056 [Tribolium madens]|uniref:uncharacterized protein LOC123011056 n=1 Tax=Tribolium madens TaxID=41895 RepID=UPI001CF75682|nr:uncharacterized protein LOC123011056 [Tribolium madens]